MKTARFDMMILLAASLLFSGNLLGQLSIDIEGGLTKTSRNDARIPGDGGTLISLSDELDADDPVFYRIRLSYMLNAKSTFSVLYAPLTIKSNGMFDRDVIFQEVIFPANTALEATYTFNSYRLTYRYNIYRSDVLEFGLGLTGKIRDADIGLQSATLQSTKEDFGFVPLINFLLRYRLHEKWRLLLAGDALAAPQGRAEDVLAALSYRPADQISLKAGYRILEGGADNDEVYTFSLIQYAVLGLTVEF